MYSNYDVIFFSMYTALDTLTEPHRYTAAMHCIAAVARPMVEGKYYPEGPNHVMPLLFAILPGIDPNDFHKCSVTFLLITSFSIMISFVDSSKAPEYWNDLTPVSFLLLLLFLIIIFYFLLDKILIVFLIYLIYLVLLGF